MEGQSLTLKYFVLNPFSSDEDYAYASKEAILKFSECIKEKNPQMAEDLEGWINYGPTL